MEGKPNPLGFLELDISDIVVGTRIRSDYGDLESLKRSIRNYDVLEPLIVDRGEGEDVYRLINGGRRLQCLKEMGRKKVPCRVFDSLNEDQRRELELELCIKQKQLSYAEEARAVRELVERRTKNNPHGILSPFGSTLKKKDIAKELNMSPPALSQLLSIAENLDLYPHMETQCTTKNQALRMIASGELISPSESLAKVAFEESFTVGTALDLVRSIQEHKVVDLFILQSDVIDKELVGECYKRLKHGGSLVIFVDISKVGDWVDYLKSLDLHVHSMPYMWNVKDESRYEPFIWAGRSRDNPMRMIPPIQSYPRNAGSISLKGKCYKLISSIVKGCCERGSFVVVPDCYDIETLKVCYDTFMNVRASCPDSVIRDRLIMNCDR
jgi:hypothetical protein